jgi:hypothetical protein
MNMNKQYRAEIRQLRRNSRKVQSDFKILTRDCEADLRSLVRFHMRTKKRVEREEARINRRIAILEGRLS